MCLGFWTLEFGYGGYGPGCVVWSAGKDREGRRSAWNCVSGWSPDRLWAVSRQLPDLLLIPNGSLTSRLGLFHDEISRACETTIQPHTRARLRELKDNLRFDRCR
jgi:hypothetical protein